MGIMEKRRKDGRLHKFCLAQTKGGQVKTIGQFFWISQMDAPLLCKHRHRCAVTPSPNFDKVVIDLKGFRLSSFRIEILNPNFIAIILDFICIR